MDIDPKRKLYIQDTTPRDGMLAIRHMYTLDQVRAIAGALDKAGVSAIEVTHGDGLRGGSFNYGFGRHTDADWISAAAEVVDNAVLTVLLLPGIGTVHDLKEAYERGARSVELHGDRIEVIVPRRRAAAVERTLTKLLNHAPRSIPLRSDATPRGIGRVGRLPSPEPLVELAARLKAVLGAPGVRVSAPDLHATVSKVGVLGGDGRRFVNAAVFAGCDALITGDVDHHTALEARARGLALIDVGHWASERHVAALVAERLRADLAEEPVEVLVSEVDTQPFAIV